MRITKLLRKDLIKAYKIDKNYVTGHTLASIKSNYAKNPNLFVACYDKQRLIGLCWGSKRPKHEIILRGIAVEARYQKKRIGKNLLKYFEKQVKNIAGWKITVGAANGPTNVVGFYAKSGYKIIKPYKKYTVMEKRV